MLADCRGGRTGPIGPEYGVSGPVQSLAGAPPAGLIGDRRARLLIAPELTAGSWVRPGWAVIERSFADALGVRVGERITPDGRLFRVGGVAVTAAFPVFEIGFLVGSARWPNPGLVWMTTADTQTLARPGSPGGFVLNLKVALAAVNAIPIHPGGGAGLTTRHGGDAGPRRDAR